LVTKMPKSGLKLKAIANRRYNLLGYRIRTQLPAETIFDQAATNLLQRARGEDARSEDACSEDARGEDARGEDACSEEARGKDACSEDADEVRYSDSNDCKDDDDSRRRSWTWEQKLAAIKYATTTIITDEKSGIKKLIPRHAAAKNIKCTAKMLRT
jgi:hypothetical protein